MTSHDSALRRTRATCICFVYAPLSSHSSITPTPAIGLCYSPQAQGQEKPPSPRCLARRKLSKAMQLSLLPDFAKRQLCGEELREVGSAVAHEGAQEHSFR